MITEIYVQHYNIKTYVGVLYLIQKNQKLFGHLCVVRKKGNTKNTNFFSQEKSKQEGNL